MEKDLLFQSEEGFFNVRAAGVLVKDNMLLLQKDIGGSEYALPGGQVRFCEEAKNALEREFIEETGAKIQTGKLMWTEECFWTMNGADRHTITFYFEVFDTENALPAVPDKFVPQNDNPNVVWGFVPIAALDNITVYPSFLARALSKTAPGILHFITKA